VVVSYCLSSHSESSHLCVLTNVIDFSLPFGCLAAYFQVPLQCYTSKLVEDACVQALRTLLQVITTITAAATAGCRHYYSAPYHYHLVLATSYSILD
jgi:S-ribosylhomocysteine lyase LuxS involved in autoinducer biosynthesis